MSTVAQITPRLPGWPELLAACLQAVATTPFAWGRHDCCTFAGDAVQAIRGADPMADLRGAYKSQRSAAKVLKAEGGLPAAVSRRLGEPKAPLLAQRGDVVLFTMQGTGPALGVCTGSSFCAPGPQGLVVLGMQAALAAWSV